ncbi:MAG: class I SAM-dependent methyltransferase, partial [Anaeroplasmataceae bacterium]|nr:class I SAM-dependent methyltransferase [Anaeroplasmataceae bacterium]
MNRIETLAYFARNSKKLCDIGCDHAYTLVEAMRTYNVEAGIAADIAIGPLENARKTLKKFHLENRVQVIQSDGFSAISEDSFDTAYGGVNNHYNHSYDGGYDDHYDTEEEHPVFGTDF